MRGGGEGSEIVHVDGVLNLFLNVEEAIRQRGVNRRVEPLAIAEGAQVRRRKGNRRDFRHNGVNGADE